MTLQELSTEWQDVESFHATVNEHFCELVNADSELCNHRDIINNNEWGFGEKSFWWLWKILLAELPDDAKLCEVGVHMGATLSLWRFLKQKAHIIGISPLNGSDGYEEKDYWKYICVVHQAFHQQPPIVIDGYSQDEWVIKGAKNHSPFDVLYVDGLHSYEGCLSDLLNYAPMVARGGYLVVDDSGRYFKLPPGMYSGHEGVSNAVRDWDKDDFEFVASVVHISIYRRK